MTKKDLIRILSPAIPETELRQLPVLEHIWLWLKRLHARPELEAQWAAYKGIEGPVKLGESPPKPDLTEVEVPLTLEERQEIFAKRLDGYFNRPVKIVKSADEEHETRKVSTAGRRTELNSPSRAQ